MYVLQQDDSFEVYTNIRKVYFLKLRKILKNYPEYLYFLDEKYFWFYSFNIFYSWYFTRREFDILIKDKIKYLKWNFWERRKLLYYFPDDIYLWLEKKDYLIWLNWDIYFKLRFIFLDIDVYDDFLYVWKLPENNVYPKRFFLIKFLKDYIQKRNYVIFEFNEEIINLIIVKDWFYNNIKSLKFWLNYLKKLFLEKWLEFLFFKLKFWFDMNEKEKYLSNLILDFYFKMLKNWYSDNVNEFIPIILIGINKEFLLNYFTKYFNNFVLPFNKSSYFKNNDLPIYINSFLVYKI